MDSDVDDASSESRPADGAVDTTGSSERALAGSRERSPSPDPDEPSGPARLRSRSLRADPDEDTLDRLKEIFGPGRVRLAWTGNGRTGNGG